MKLQVIQTEKGYMVVSEEEIKERDWFYNPIDCNKYGYSDKIHICKSTPLDGFTKESIHIITGDFRFARENCKKIVATDQSFKLDGIPQFELENPDDELYNQIPNIGKGDGIEQLFFGDGYISGYKAATKQYTEEDLRTAIFKAIDIWMNNMTEDSAEINEKDFQSIIQSLNQPKKLVAIDVETEQIIFKEKYNSCEYNNERVGCIADICNCYTLIPKVINGFLTVKQYYYE